MSQLLETIKIIDGEIMFPDYHNSRIKKSIYFIFNKKLDYDISKLINIPLLYKNGVVKCRFIYDDLSYRYEFAFYEKRKISTLKLVECPSITYNFKYLNREDLETCLLQKNNCDEIIIVKDGLITDTSFSNLIFFDGKKWFTPKSFLLNGTCRQRLINEQKIEEQDISIDEISYFVGFKLINAMLYPEDSEMISVSNLSI
jgi:4-amino-4-deoxychorismate lyase